MLVVTETASVELKKALDEIFNVIVHEFSISD